MTSSVLVTGGTSDIGRAVTKRFLEDGWHVHLHYHRSEDVARELAGGEENVEAVQADLSSPEDCSGLADRLRRDEELSVLVNNAAVFRRTSGEEEPEDWDLPMNVNARAPWKLSTRLSERLAGNEGSVVNLTDAASDRPYSDYLPYFASKGALETLTRGLARKLSPDVRVNAVAPGPIDFPDSYSEDERRAVINRTLLEREGTHEEIARTCHFLATEATYTTGSVLEVDGGRHLN